MTQHDFALQIRRSLIQIVSLLKAGKPVEQALLIALPAVIKAIERYYGIGQELTVTQPGETDTISQP